MRIQLGLIMAALLFAVEALHAAAKPNIMFIMADDLGYGDLGCYGQEQIHTPQIDRLARDGIRFTQAYAGSSVCAPTRAILMTGLHCGHAAVRDNIPHYDSYLQDEDVTLAERLKQAGYRTGGVGKWSLGDAGTVGRATRQGFDMWLGYLNQDHAHYYYTEYLDDGEGRVELSGNTESKKHYSHDLLTQRALEFIRASKDESFFFYGAYTLPHFAARSEDPTRLPIPSDAPYSEKEWSQTAKNYAAMVTMLDRDVGKIVALVDRLGLREKTLIVFTSDNGPWGLLPKTFRSAGPLRGVKRDLYEGGIRVPFVARWPGQIPAGRTSREVIAFWDILPTLVELAGASAPARTDGISIVSALKGGKLAKPHTYLYWDYGHCRSRYDQAVRLGNWKGIRLGLGNAVELYDLAQDIGETHNVAAEQTKIVRQIEQIMATAATPSPRYPIGKIYKGSKKWKPAARKGS